MTTFLAFQHAHGSIEAALFRDHELVDNIFEDKKRSSKHFVSMIESLLAKNNCELGDLSFIAANQGPGPFTTLRVVIASVNGLAFSCNKPLIGIDGLDAILQQFHSEQFPTTVALLDAFSQDVYFGIDYVKSLQYEKGYKNIDLLLVDLSSSFKSRTIRFIGNGSQKYQEKIVSVFGDRAIFPEPLPLNCSIEKIGRMAYEKWQKQVGLSDQLLPTYLKSMVLKKVLPSTF